MSNDLENYTTTSSDKMLQTQPQTTRSDVNLENGSKSFASYQSALSATPTYNENSNNGRIVNGCNDTCRGGEDLRNSAVSTDRDKLYRSIYNSSSSEDEDEHCVYTYKGAEVGSDLPGSFLHVDVNGRNRGSTSGRSSPEMDFLEMDFDPGPSCGQDSDSDSSSLYRAVSSYDPRNCDLRSTIEKSDRVDGNKPDNAQHDSYDENANCCSNKSLINYEVASGGLFNFNSVALVKETTLRDNPCCSKSLQGSENENNNVECTAGSLENTTLNYSDLLSNEELSTGNNAYSIDGSSVSDDSNTVEVGENVCDQRFSDDSDSEEITFIASGYDPIEPNDNSSENLFENLSDISLVKTKTSTNDFISYDDLLPLDPAYSISTVVNVMKLLNNSESNEKEQLANLLQPKLVPESTPLVEYLLMRSVQNANEIDLVNFASIISKDKLYSRFFSTYPNAHFNLVEWLYSWMRRGAVPVVTRNIQERGTLASKDIVRNSWRHNVVYKLESPYVHLSNPFERVLDCVLHSQLSQPSLIYVKRKCILQRWHSKVDLRLLMRANHNRWYNENVLGQVATIIRENDNSTNSTKYVRIPSNCRCGITLFVPSENSTLCREIDEAIELTTTECP